MTTIPSTKICTPLIETTNEPQKIFVMKQLPEITSVQSKVRFLDTDLHKLLDRKNEIRWFWKRNNEIKATVMIDGYETIKSTSVNILLKGIVEICFSGHNKKDIGVIFVPARTHFLVTCISRNNGNYFPAMEASLS